MQRIVNGCAKCFDSKALKASGTKTFFFPFPPTISGAFWAWNAPELLEVRISNVLHISKFAFWHPWDGFDFESIRHWGDVFYTLLPWVEADGSWNPKRQENHSFVCSCFTQRRKYWVNSMFFKLGNFTMCGFLTPRVPHPAWNSGSWSPHIIKFPSWKNIELNGPIVLLSIRQLLLSIVYFCLLSTPIIIVSLGNNYFISIFDFVVRLYILHGWEISYG